MTRGIVLRAVALVAIAGQLQLLPAALGCAAEHARPVASHCDAAPAPGNALTPVADCHTAQGCLLGIGCTASAAVPSLGYTVALSGDATAVPARVGLTPTSFDSSPAPPPPQV